jgi:hypothetical protein
MMHFPEADDLPAFSALHFQAVGVAEAAAAVDDAHLACTGHAGQAAGELADYLVLVRAQRGEIDLGRMEADAGTGQPVRFLHRRRQVQQRLRRDAADVEADAAQRRMALDQQVSMPRSAARKAAE